MCCAAGLINCDHIAGTRAKTARNSFRLIGRLAVIRSSWQNANRADRHGTIVCGTGSASAQNVTDLWMPTMSTALRNARIQIETISRLRK